MVQIDNSLAAELIETAHVLADAAGQVILPHFRNPNLTSDNKLSVGFDPVTIADRDAEAAMREILAQRRPDDAILGEEFGATAGTTGLAWVLDPIDGTRGFISGTPTWGVLIAVAGQDGPVMGVIDQPYTGERFIGGLGQAEWTGPLGRAALGTRHTQDIADALVFTTFPEVGTPADGAAFARVSRQAKLTRYGMDCYAYALLAAGQIDLVIEAGLNAYDIQAPIAVIEAAGGIVTDWRGGKAHNGGRAVAASNATLHAKALEILNAAS